MREIRTVELEEHQLRNDVVESGRGSNKHDRVDLCGERLQYRGASRAEG